MMKCPKCNKNIKQVSGMWTPETPDVTYRKYICYGCEVGYTEVFDRASQKVIRVDETDLSVQKEVQTSLLDW